MPYPYGYDDHEKKVEHPKLQTNRSMWKFMLLNLVTCGLYSIAFFIPFTFDLERVYPSREGRKPMNYLWAYILAFFTASIVLAVWFYQISEKVEDALSKRNISYGFGTSTFWGWYILGSFFLVGPFVYFHKLCKAMNLLCADYNQNPVIPE